MGRFDRKTFSITYFFFTFFILNLFSYVLNFPLKMLLGGFSSIVTMKVLYCIALLRLVGVRPRRRNWMYPNWRAVVVVGTLLMSKSKWRNLAIKRWLRQNHGAKVA